MDKNQVLLEGRLVSDLVLRQAGEASVVNLRLANNNYKNYKKQAMYYDCVVWGRVAEDLVKKAKIGDTISALGLLETYQQELYGKEGQVLDQSGKPINITSTRIKIMEADVIRSRKNQKIYEEELARKEAAGEGYKAPAPTNQPAPQPKPAVQKTEPVKQAQPVVEEKLEEVDDIELDLFSDDGNLPF